MEGFLVVLFSGERCADRGAGDPWLAMLRDVVRGSRGSVLVQTGRLGPRLPGRLVVVQPRHPDDPVGPITAAAVWLGPLTSADQLEALRGWLSAGGPACAPLPAVLVPVRFVPVRLPVASLN
jgi:hypothetical protein